MNARAVMTPESNLVPALWEVEFRVADVTSRQQGIPREKVRPDSRILEELNIDSLDLVELLLALEEEFGVSIPDDIGKLMFVRSPLTIAALAEIVRHQWGTGIPERKGWLHGRPKLPVFHTTPFTQLGGILLTGKGNLFERMAPNPEGFPQFQRRTDGMRCVAIPAADVGLGSGTSAAADDERPRHQALLDGFLMDTEPVSVTAFVRFLNSTMDQASPFIGEWCGVSANDRRGRHFQLRLDGRRWEPVSGTERQPMVLVSWFGASAYSLWANGRDWRRFRDDGLLPTEAQWEYAARGRFGREFPWGDEPATPELALVGLHRSRADYPVLLPLADVHAQLGMSPFGLHHMAGNVWQWCRDWYAGDFYQQPEAAQPNPQQNRPTGIRAERGGSWVGPGELARSSYRRGRPPMAVGRCLGFRCVSEVKDLPV